MTFSRRGALFGAVGSVVTASLWARAAEASTATYTYDALGRVKKVVYPDGSITNYSYDAAGNRTQRVDTASGTSFNRTIQITGAGPVNLYNLAVAEGYGGQNAVITFEVVTGVTLEGPGGAGGYSDGSAGQPGLPAIETGLWPGGVAISLTLDIKSGATVRGGGGGGGGGAGSAYNSGYNPGPGTGGAAGAAISCGRPMTIIVRSGATVTSGGTGGDGGAGYEEPLYYYYDTGWWGGGGGGGGYPNGGGGSGGNIPIVSPYYYMSSEPGLVGDDGTTSGGGAGGAGGAGGQNGAGSPGSSGSGAGGYAIAKNGHTVGVTNSGTIIGWVG